MQIWKKIFFETTEKRTISKIKRQNILINYFNDNNFDVKLRGKTMKKGKLFNNLLLLLFVLVIHNVYEFRFVIC